MKIATHIIRTLIGILLLFASITFFFKLFPEPEFSGNLKQFNDGLKASFYMMPLVKFLELVCGISYLSNRFVSFSSLVLLPLTVNILLINLFMSQQGLPIAIPLFLGNIFMIYINWNHYKLVILEK